ncbi:hypothetical protein BVRB_1g022140 [Beta vulgaris subsp. vulgaris]|nr:hypothetical protein BVRB_1g022140 [Beta vulgaris subsp. vulgaris]
MKQHRLNYKTMIYFGEDTTTMNSSLTSSALMELHGKHISTSILPPPSFPG